MIFKQKYPNTNGQIEYIWQFSKYGADMLNTACRLYDKDEWYAATSILFNAIEFLLKAFREDYRENLVQDINSLKTAGLITEEEESFFNNNRNGLRRIRNIMTHKDAYEYFFEAPDGILYPFNEMDTWDDIFVFFAPRSIEILFSVLKRINEK